MEIHIKDNAINSLEVGLDFYKKFIPKSDSLDISVRRYGNLKFAVISIHNAIELFTKAILIDINEFLVFDLNTENNKVLHRLLRQQYNNKRKKANIAYHAVFTTNSYKTIDYSKCISILHSIFNDKINENDYKVLDDLKEYRNSLTHLGYASTFEWYKILIVLNKSLELILTFYVNNLIKSENYFSKGIINKIQSVLELSKPYIYDVWMASWDSILDDIEEELVNFFNNSQTVVNGIDIDGEHGRFKQADLIYCNNGQDMGLEWIFIYSYLNDAIIIVDKDDIVVGSICIDDRDLVFHLDEMGFPKGLKVVYIYIPTKKLKYKEEDIYKYNGNKSFGKLELKPAAFQGLIKNYIKNMDK